jgi:hypothetical protein
MGKFVKVFLVAVLVSVGGVWAQCSWLCGANQAISTNSLLFFTSTTKSSEQSMVAVPTHTIRFYTDGGTAAANLSGRRDENIVLPATRRSGFTFAGWYTAPDGEGRRVGSSGDHYQIVSNATLYAHWKANSIPEPIRQNSTARNHPIVGTWRLRFGTNQEWQTKGLYVFNSNSTGIRRGIDVYYGTISAFTWNLANRRVRITHDNGEEYFFTFSGGDSFALKGREFIKIGSALEYNTFETLMLNRQQHF